MAEAARRLARSSVVRPVVLGGEGSPSEGWSPAEALGRAATMLRRGEADGVVAGAVLTTAEVIRTALREVGLRSGVRTLSSSFFMEAPPRAAAGAREAGQTRAAAESSGAGRKGGRGRAPLTFTDPAVVPHPGPRQLAEIAAEAVLLRRSVVGDAPRVAFLSYSTLGSADGRSVDRVRQAVARFRERHPEVPADGELQGDAALVAEVARAKAPGSPVAGAANVLVFPSLDAANIAYKLVQRLAGAVAVGPILQGLAAPVNDLSRAASVSDIEQVAAVTALMADPSERPKALS